MNKLIDHTLDSQLRQVLERHPKISDRKFYPRENRFRADGRIRPTGCWRYEDNPRYRFTGFK